MPAEPALLPSGTSHIIGIFAMLATETLRSRMQERMIIAGFNARGVIVHWAEFDGGADHILFDLDHLGAIMSDPGTQYIAMAHNHPSGNPYPSKEDIRTTRRLADFCNETGLKLVEHIIIGSTENHHIFAQSRA